MHRDTPTDPHHDGIFSYENRLLVVLFLVFGLVFLERLALPFLWPQISQELQLTNAHLGMLSSALALAWAVSGAALGYAADKWRMRRPLFLLAIVTFSLCSAFSGMVGGFAALLFFRLVMGSAEGPVLPISQSFMVQASQERRRGLNMGIITGVGPGLIGAVLGPPIMIGLAAEFGWRVAFYLTVIPGLVLALFLYRMLRQQSEPTADTAVSQGDHSRWVDLLRIKNIRLCVAISCVFITWFLAILNFGPTFLVKERGFTEAQMGMVMSAIGFAWVFWSFVLPALSDRIGRKPVMVIFSLTAAACPYLLATVSEPSVLAIAVFLSFTGIGCFTLFMATIPSETVSPTLIATALGLVMGTGEVIGGGVVPFAAGFLADRYGLVIVMWIAGGGAVAATLLSLLLDETAPIKANRSGDLTRAS